jgi:hypothetical protein
LPHQLDLRQTEFFSFGEVIARFVRQIRLPERTIHRFVRHDFTTLWILDSLSNKKVSNDLSPSVLRDENLPIRFQSFATDPEISEVVG